MRSDKYLPMKQKRQKRKRAAAGFLKVLLLLFMVLLGTGCLVRIDTLNAVSYGLEPKINFTVEKSGNGQYAVNCFGTTFSIEKSRKTP